MKEVIVKLNKFKDVKYKSFQAHLIPTIDDNAIIGVRTPKLKEFAKEMIKNGESVSFIKELPHQFFDENQLHAFIISENKDYNKCIREISEFLPYIDNWATCDQLSPKVFKKNKNDLIKHIRMWIKSDKPYVIRFAIGMLMSHYLDEDFDEKYLEMVAKVKFGKLKFDDKISISDNPDKYYVEMMRAWFFATALAKQYDATLPYIKDKKLNIWTHNKTIGKAVESYRISDKHKEILKKLKFS